MGACAMPGGKPPSARALQLEPSLASPEALPGAGDAAGPAGDGRYPGSGPGTRLGSGLNASGAAGAGEAAVGGMQRPTMAEAAFPGFAVPTSREFEGAARSGLGSPARRSVGSPASARSPTGKGASSPACLQLSVGWAVAIRQMNTQCAGT